MGWDGRHLGVQFAWGHGAIVHARWSASSPLHDAVRCKFVDELAWRVNRGNRRATNIFIQEMPIRRKRNRCREIQFRKPGRAGKSMSQVDAWKVSFGNWSRCWSDIPPSIDPSPTSSRPTFDRRQSLTVVGQLARPLPGPRWPRTCMSDAVRCQRIYNNNINSLHVARTMQHTRSLACTLPRSSWPSSCMVMQRVKPHRKQLVAGYSRRDAVRQALCKWLQLLESTQIDRRDALK